MGVSPVLAVSCALLGLLIGSFANVCIHRIPLAESVVSPRSRCPKCRRAIAAWDNVPLLSWLILRGKCRGCHAPISVRYPFVELTNGVFYGLIGWLHGINGRSVAQMALVTILLILALIDLDHRILPNIVTLPGIAFGLAAAVVAPPPGLLESALSAAGMYAAFALIARLYERLRGIEGLGQGDWKMAAMLGAFLGWQGSLFAVFAGAALGAITGGLMIAVAKKDSKYALPFGTFLALGGFAAILVGEPVLTWYGQFLG